MRAHEVSQIIGCFIALYLAGLLLAAHQLKAKHGDVWNSLGRPSLLNWSILSSFKLGRYVFLSSAHAKLNDKQLTATVYCLRILFILTVGLIVWWKLSF
jgi:hypothetical protein